MARRYKNKKLYGIISFVLAAVLLIGSVVGISAIANKETKTINSLSFKVGGVDDSGNYKKTTASIYTKDFIECQGLKIEPDFEANGVFQVFYYSSDKSFIGATEKLSAKSGTYEKGDTYAFAKYARIVITPEPTNDEDEIKIKFYNVSKYANEYTFTVNKNQPKIDYKLIIKDIPNSASVLGEGILDGDGSFVEEKMGYYCFDKIDVSKSNIIVVKVSNSTFENKTLAHSFPLLYDCEGKKEIAQSDKPGFDCSFSVLGSDTDFTYIAYYVSPYSTISGLVDIYSADCLEIYIL